MTKEQIEKMGYSELEEILRFLENKRHYGLTIEKMNDYLFTPGLKSMVFEELERRKQSYNTNW